MHIQATEIQSLIFMVPLLEILPTVCTLGSEPKAGTQSCCHLGALACVHPHASGSLIYSPTSGGSAVAASDSPFLSTASTLCNLTTSQGPLQCYLPTGFPEHSHSHLTLEVLWNFIHLFNILHSLFQLFKCIHKYSKSGWKLLEVKIEIDKDFKNSKLQDRR